MDTGAGEVSQELISGKHHPCQGSTWYRELTESSKSENEPAKGHFPLFLESPPSFKSSPGGAETEMIEQTAGSKPQLKTEQKEKKLWIDCEIAVCM